MFIFSSPFIELTYNKAPTEAPISLHPSRAPTDTVFNFKLDFLFTLNHSPFVSLCVNFRKSLDKKNQPYEQGAGKSYVNNRNISVAMDIIRIMTIVNGIQQRDIKIFTPYRRKYFNSISNSKLLFLAQVTRYMRALIQAGFREVEVNSIDKSPGIQAEHTIIDFVRFDNPGFLAGTPENFPSARQNGRMLVGLTRCRKTRICLLSTPLPEGGRYKNDVQWLALAHRDHPSGFVHYVESQI